MREENAIQIIQSVGAYHADGHYLLASGRHSADYIDSDRLCLMPDRAELFSEALAANFSDNGMGITAVVGVPDGATYLAGRLAHIIRVRSGCRREVLFIRLTKVPGEDHPLRREFHINATYAEALKGQRVLLLEDVLSSGASTKAALRLIQKQEAEVVAVGTLWNRGGVTAEDLGVETLYALVNRPLKSYAPGVATCPGCYQKKEIDQSVGHGLRQRDDDQPRLAAVK